MKNELAFKKINDLLIKICNKNLKHKIINCVFVLDYKIKNKASKFMQNYAVEIKNIFKNHDKFLVFLNDENLNNVKINFDCNIINGFEINQKKIKKDIKWCVVDKYGLSKIDKLKSIINKKSLLPNNYINYENVPILDQINLIKNGKLIKITQLNNYVSFSCGDLDKLNSLEISENAFEVYKFLKEKLKYIIKKIYFYQNMQKSKKI